jgi:hypothetical protein
MPMVIIAAVQPPPEGGVLPEIVLPAQVVIIEIFSMY